MIQIYHNSRCGKSRNCLAIIENSNQEFQVISYLKTPPSFDELSQVIKQLNINPIDLVRKKEKIWIENFKDNEYDNNELIMIMIEFPILIERPIVIKNNLAIIGRNSDELKKFLS